MNILYVADYSEAHPRGFSLCMGLQHNGLNCEFLTFSKYLSRINSEKDLNTFNNFRYIDESVVSVMQALIPTRAFKSFWPFLSVTFFESLKTLGIWNSLQKSEYQKFDFVIISYSPLSLVLAVIFSDKFSSTKKIIDWRDPYLNNHNTPSKKLRTIVRSFIVKIIDRRVDFHTTVSEGFRDRLQAVCVKPIFVIPNGSNQNLLGYKMLKDKPTEVNNNSNISINYFGSIYKDRQPLIKCLSHMERYCEEMGCIIHLNFYGTNRKLLGKAISGKKFQNLSISVFDKLDYAEFVHATRFGDLNMVIGWNSRPDDIFKGAGVLPTKFWECLGIDVPLLIYSENEHDEMTKIAQEDFGLPVVSDYQSLYDFFQKFHLLDFTRDIDEYSFENRAKQLINLLRSY